MGLLWLSIVAAVFSVALGAAVVRRAPRHPAHLSFGIGMTVFGAEAMLSSLALCPTTADMPVAWEEWRLLVSALLPAPWLVFSRCYSRGGNPWTLAGRPWSLAALALLPLLVGLVLRSNILLQLPPAPSIPGSPSESVRLGGAGIAIEALVLLASVAVLTNLERTFRSSVGVMRWRIKYMVLGAGALLGFRLYAASQALLYQAPEEPVGHARAAALLLACVLFAIALTRGSVFDVDVYPSQTLLYGSLTILLAGAYLVIVGVLSNLVSLVGGTIAFPLQAFIILLALVGLAVMLLSERLRLRIRRFVSRHFRRPIHDYRRVWSTFTARTSSLVDEAAFCREVARWTSEAFESLAASVWLVDESGDRFRLGGSTVLADATACRLDIPELEVREAVAALSRLHEPINLGSSRQPWVGVLQRLHAGIFRSGGSAVAQPLAAGGRLLGVLTLADRVGGQPFTTEDSDLLKCIGDQIAANLLGLQLSARLLRTKEMEAFQAMSTFFVHDLKNTASTLSLTLQNLHQHFADPAFRDDALRAVGKSVNHLNDLITRLSRLREGLKVQPAPTDLSRVVQSAIAALGPAPGIKVETQIQPTPQALVDAEQLQKVALNLLLNARDASAAGATVRVETTTHHGWAALSVTDSGCGMSPEFVARSLFRPFQTTKKNGLGIGMFHSRMIVEAHRGRMEVDTAPGRGTTIRVLLPLAATA